jgi:hypothetical protein
LFFTLLYLVILQIVNLQYIDITPIYRSLSNTKDLDKRGEELSRYIINRISGGRLVNEVNCRRDTSETAVDGIAVFDTIKSSECNQYRQKRHRHYVCPKSMAGEYEAEWDYFIGAARAGSRDLSDCVAALKAVNQF